MIAIHPARPARAVPVCATCTHFDDSVAAIEAALQGLGSLGSARGAARSTDGVCRLKGRCLAADRWCEDHAPRARP